MFNIKGSFYILNDMLVKLKDFYEFYFKPVPLENCFYKSTATDKSVFDAWMHTNQLEFYTYMCVQVKEYELNSSNVSHIQMIYVLVSLYR